MVSATGDSAFFVIAAAGFTGFFAAGFLLVCAWTWSVKQHATNSIIYTLSFLILVPLLFKDTKGPYSLHHYHAILAKK
jgi:hypothetical protein